LPRYALLLISISSGAATILVLLLASGRVSLGGAGPSQSTAGSALGSDSTAPPPRRLFAAGSVWNRPLPARVPLDPNSRRIVAGLTREVEGELRRGVGPWIGAGTCSTPLYIVPPRQREVRVLLTDPHEAWRLGLAKVFKRVPLPARAEPAACSDAHLTVWQPARDRLWEFFGLQREGGSWRADWGGAMKRVSRSPGFYDSRSWPGRSSFTWGATATSLPVVAGVMRLAELRRGRIDHALAMNVPTARRGVLAWPAQRSDGIGSAGDLPEGARLRLDPGLDLTSLNLPPLTLAMAEAAQAYGIVVRDQTGPGNGISFFGEEPQGSSRPYSRDGGFYDGMTPDQLLAPFPWTHLQLLKMKLCRSGPCRW
jgi:hypothetical protein